MDKTIGKYNKGEELSRRSQLGGVILNKNPPDNIKSARWRGLLIGGVAGLAKFLREIKFTPFPVRAFKGGFYVVFESSVGGLSFTSTGTVRELPLLAYRLHLE